MSFNSKAFLADRERLLEPELLRGNYRGHGELRTSMADKNAWLNSLNDAERQQLAAEYDYEQSKKQYQW